LEETSTHPEQGSLAENLARASSVSLQSYLGFLSSDGETASQKAGDYGLDAFPSYYPWIVAEKNGLPRECVPLWAVSFLTAVLDETLRRPVLPWHRKRRFIASPRQDGNTDILMLSAAPQTEVRSVNVPDLLANALRSERTSDRITRILRESSEEGDWAAETLTSVSRQSRTVGPTMPLIALGVAAVAECRPNVVVAPKPKMIPLCVPTPPFDIEAGAKRSTSGVLVQDSNGHRGITACFHGAGPIGTEVLVGSLRCKVTAADQVQDACFIPLGDGVNFPEMLGSKGVLTRRPPWQTERARFYGGSSGDKWCRITGIDVGLPGVRPGRQLCVQTTPDTDEGDSGAALINENDEVMGFAFQRTAWGEPLQFTDWIWAASALQALNLRLINL
jgi:hypothetical protein